MLFVVKTIDTRKFWVMLTSTLVSSQDLSLQGNAFSLFPTVKLYFCVMCLQSDWWNLMIGVQFCFLLFFFFFFFFRFTCKCSLPFYTSFSSFLTGKGFSQPFSIQRVLPTEKARHWVLSYLILSLSAWGMSEVCKRWLLVNK